LSYARSQKAAFARKDLHHLQKAVYLAQEMGKELGPG
jgi:hypothetical protein